MNDDDPTPEQILRECWKIQDRWTLDETRKRAAWCYQQSEVVVPTISLPEQRGELQS
jgi:hypothetical protein